MAVKVPLVRDSTTNLPIELSASDTIAKASVGLGSVDNTSDLNKPISTATQTALNAKAGLTTTNTFTGANTFTGVNGLRVDGAGNGRLSLLNDGVRRALLSSSGEVVSLVAYMVDGGTSTGQLDIGTGGMKYWGSATVTGTITASNLSGTNTGDQTSVSGNAGTATKLQTPRAISGVTFDGSAPITIPYSGLSGLPTLGTAASKDSGDFASSTTYGGGDLNTLLTSGVYRLNNNVTNGPTGSLYGQLLVLHGGSDTQAQQYFPYASSDVYTRGGSSSGATWQPWVKHWHSGNLDPASFATAAQGAKADAALPAANLSGFTKFAVVTALPGSPDPNTIYFVK